MWIFTTLGFFSITKAHPEEWDYPVPDGSLQVRARVKDDLFNMLDAVGSNADVLQTFNRDYPYRTFLPPETVAKFLAEYTEDLEYNNFKDEVAKVQGYHRSKLYSKVWSVMYNAEDEG